MTLTGKLFDGPLDVIGDVHGEIGALTTLLERLGYRDGIHPERRRLVFVGDLVDRGPDSPAVMRLVQALVQAGHAQCVLGNHELNLLRGDHKHGNTWWISPKDERRAQPLDESDRDEFVAFLESLPLALERHDLRVVHACWHTTAIDKLRARASRHGSVLGIFDHFERQIRKRLTNDNLSIEADRERKTHGYPLTDLEHKPALMHARAKSDELRQMGNPIRILTSGEEKATNVPFKAGGKWRMVERRKWWNHYDEATPVIMGHYWRRLANAKDPFCGKYGPDLFEGIEPHHLMGKRKNVYCVDFSVGARSSLRKNGGSELDCSLAAVRVPAGTDISGWEVMHDTGMTFSIETS